MKTQETIELFAKLPWLNISAFAELVGIEKNNLNKYIKGDLEVSEKTYRRLLEGLRKIKETLP